jgi:hypothetical protein
MTLGRTALFRVVPSNLAPSFNMTTNIRNTRERQPLKLWTLPFDKHAQISEGTSEASCVDVL